MKNQNDAEIAHPILVIKARMSKGVWALPVTRTGPYRTNIIQRVMAIINSIGSPKIIIKTEQEPAMTTMQSELRKELWNEALQIAERIKDMKLNSPAGESQSNGIIENAIK